MHARVTSLSGSPDEVDAGIADFREKVVPFTHEQGGKGGILLVDRETGAAIAITLWEDEQALRASEERANQLRAAVAEEMHVSEQPTVNRYEVPVRSRRLRTVVPGQTRLPPSRLCFDLPSLPRPRNNHCCGPNSRTQASRSDRAPRTGERSTDGSYALEDLVAVPPKRDSGTTSQGRATTLGGAERPFGPVHLEPGRQRQARHRFSRRRQD
jgi:hypothetical protein